VAKARTDQAALAGAALAAVITVAVAEGAWALFDSVVGLSLLAVLGAYYRVEDWSGTPGWVITNGLALGAIVGVLLFLALAWPMQWVLVTSADLISTCTEVLETTRGYGPFEATVSNVSASEVIARGFVPSDYVVGAQEDSFLARIDGCVAHNTTNKLLLPLWMLTVAGTMLFFVVRWRAAKAASTGP
jgi:hypothetical protein